MHETGELQNRELFLAIINVRRTLILGLPQNKTAVPLAILLFNQLYLHKNAEFSAYEGYLSYTGKVRNRRAAKSQIVLLLLIIIILVKTFILRQLIHGCRYCSINSTNQLRLLVSSDFWVKKESTGGQISSKNYSIRARLVCSYFRNNHYLARTTG